MTKYSHNSNITVLGDAIMVGQQCYTHTVVGDDVIMVNPTIIRGVLNHPLKNVLGEDAVCYLQCPLRGLF